jgi:energy-coupling factor transporter ATP-binding protein EcfA2
MVGSDDFSPPEFARAARDGALNGKYGLPDGQAALLERLLTEEALLGLDSIELCDEVSISLDLGRDGTRDYRPLERLSPGQKSTAILLMIMQASDAPLLIDQPEDDLDNRFIYDDVVMRLRAAKPLRQFVVATHNANIPVLGDAEQIIVLDASDRGGELKTRGAIDQVDVREAAELILEGGEDAFLRRRAKYGW